MPLVLVISALVWLLWAWFANRSLRLALRADPLSGAALLLVRLYARVVHRLRIEHAERIPKALRPGPLIIVANHSSGADPLLIQAVCPFEITWIMGADMAHPLLDAVWKRVSVIRVDRRGGSGFPLRDALRALRDGRVLAIFPEGRIARPPRRVLPFHPGVSLLIERSGAPVLPMIISATPSSGNAWTDLLTPGDATLRVLPVLQPGSPRGAESLRAMFGRETGWPSAD